jgi:hypothetical protein
MTGNFQQAVFKNIFSAVIIINIFLKGRSKKWHLKKFRKNH